MQENLTSREQEIFNLLLDGISPKEIAYKLHVSSKAVDYHRGNLYGKLGVHSIQELLAKYSHDRPKAGYANSAVVEPQTTSTVNKLLKNKRLWLLISAGALVFVVLVFLSWFFFIKPKASLFEFATVDKPTAEPLFTITFADNGPWGWTQKLYPDAFKNIRITAGESYTFTYTFTSDVDFDSLAVFIVDTTVESENFFRFLCPFTTITYAAQANIEHSGSVTLHMIRTASSEDPLANLFALQTHPYEASQPTLSFTQFEITKASKRDATTTSPALMAGENSYYLAFRPLPQGGWLNQIHPPSFRDTRITAGDIYTVSCSFMSDVDFDFLQVLLYDNNDPVYSPLSPTVTIAKDVKANIEYSGTVTLIAYESASDTTSSANVLRLEAIALAHDLPPTLLIIKLEITKVN